MIRKIKFIGSPLLICLLFFFAYSIISVVRHLHFGSYGFDMGITDQMVWNWSNFRIPINTIYQHPFTSAFTDHIEFIYPLIAPIYKLFSSPLTLVVLQAFVVTFSGIPVYLLAKNKKLKTSVCYTLLISYLMFYGIQNALWFDVHSLSFAAGFLPWFAYFLETKRDKLAVLFFLLSIGAKEDIALFTLLISFIYFVTSKRKINIVFILLSLAYLFAIFYIYFPHFTVDGYRFINQGGMFSNLNPSYFFDTPDKINVTLYGLLSYGFLPLLAPLYLLPGAADLTHYFILGHSVPTAQTFFMHYRVTLSFFLVWPTIFAISRFKKYLNNNFIAFYLLIAAIFCQYALHLPLSYLTKKWFWTTPSSVAAINKTIKEIPQNSSLVSQNNITPHVSKRNEIFTLWPEIKNFKSNSPCGKADCDWFRWAGNPEFLIVDTAPDWDIRHFLTNRDNFIQGINNLKNAGVIKEYKINGTTTLYKILKHP